MIRIFFFLSALISIHACSDRTETATVESTVPNEPVQIIPVTDVIRGQINDFIAKGINPKKQTIAGGKKDSSWLPVEQIVPSLAAFTRPVIDSVTIARHYKGESFADETLGLATFIYSLKPGSPDSLTISKINVYVSPETGRVSRIFMIKNEAAQTEQLTWVSDHWCKIVRLTNDSKKQISEERISWDIN